MLIYTAIPKKKLKRKPKDQQPVKKTRKPAASKSLIPKDKKYQAPGTAHIKSHIDEFLTDTAPNNPAPTRYEGDLAAREAAAQEEIRRKASCVAPAFNKGPYTYIATEEQAKWVGRK